MGPNWLIVGSVAAHHWFPETWPKCKDIDILTPDEISGTFDCRIETQWHDVAAEIIEVNRDSVFVDPDMLLTIKFSHAPWNVKWEKTMMDIHRLQEAGCQINWDFVPKLRKVWAETHGSKRVNLRQPVTEFFSHDVVKRAYPHELVHECVAFNPSPMHESIRPDLSSVWCDRAMFEALSEEGRLQCAKEEMMVVAIERLNLTSTSTIAEIRRALSYAFKNLITSMTTGWFNDFMILNARALRCHETSVDLVERIQIAILKLEKHDN